jgi:death on curing protein
MLESAVAQPLMTFDRQELYPTIANKASAICFSVVMNHPFVDGNKRVGHAALETFLVLNGQELSCPVVEQERRIFDLAAGRLKRENFTAWVQTHMVLAEHYKGLRPVWQFAMTKKVAITTISCSVVTKPGSRLLTLGIKRSRKQRVRRSSNTRVLAQPGATSDDRIAARVARNL